MKRFERTARKPIYNVFAIILLLFSLLSTSMPMNLSFADENYDDDYKEGHGSIKNEQGEMDYDEAKINKQVSFGDKPGEYFIDLRVEGKDLNAGMTTDIVIPYDLSNSMENNKVPGTNKTRTEVAAEATKDFINGLLGSGNNYRIAFVPYGTSIMDGNTTSYLGNPGRYTFQQLNPYNYYVGNFTSNASEITSKIPSTINHGNHGGTFTQQALERAGQIMSTSNADRKIIVTITDGLPTVSYNQNRAPWGTGAENQGVQNMQAHRTNTIEEANSLKNDYTLYSIGVGLSSDSADQREVIEGIADSADNAYYANTVDQLVSALNEISSQLKSNTVINGSISDPITDEFILQAPWYELTASSDSVKEGVVVSVENQQVQVDGLNLGENEWVNIRYKVQMDTDNLDLDPTEFYKTNGTTTLTPNGDEPGTKREFPEPEASAEPLKVSGKKAWVDWGYDVHRPDEITLQLVREIDGQDVVVDEVIVQKEDTDVWEFEFENAFVYDSKGQKIEYKIREIMPDGSGDYYELQYGNISEETTDARNVFQQNAKIQLEKTAKSTSELGEDKIEVGKDIEYTFEITNTGNLPLKDIKLEDELDGISAITYETLNGEPLTAGIEDVEMQPGDVIIATATYEVTQEDFDYGQVNNHAEVVGTPTVPDPERFKEMVEFDDSPVTDDDAASVPGELKPEISLTKTADKTVVTEAGKTVKYTFVVTNTGNTTLTNVEITDDLDGLSAIEYLTVNGNPIADVDNITLEPGDVLIAEATYEVTQEDINNGEIINKAAVEGTPPPAYTENPDNPDKVTDEDDEIVEADQTSAIELVKEADKDGLRVGETITYTFTATNTGNTTLTNVKITDDFDGLSAIEYLTVNGNPIADVDNITLEPGDVLIAEATYEVTQADVDEGQVYNEATVTGKDPKDEEVTDEDDVTITEEAVKGIDLVKTSDKEYVTEAGQEIEYSFEVTNRGNVTLRDVIVKDPMLGGNIEVAASLAPGETITITKTYTVTEEDIEKESIKNIATATGTPPNPEDDPPTSPPAEDQVPVAKIELEKSVLPVIYTEVGQELVYTLVITNTGEVTLNEVTLTDDMLGGEITLDVNSLAPGESTTVEVPYTVTEADVEAGEIVNTAEVEGTPEGYDPENPNTPDKVRDEDNATANYAGLIIEKTSDKEVVVEAGEEIIYTFTITNIGTTVLEKIVVNDEMLEELDIQIELVKTRLEPGESTTGTATYTVTQEDIDNGGVYNLATATGTPPGYDPEDPKFPDEPPVSPPSEEYVPSDRNPAIKLIKSTVTEEYVEVGQEILYTFTVTNTGNTTLENVFVYDETFDVYVDLIHEGHQGPGTKYITLEPGESAVGTYTHTVIQADLDNGEIHNFASTEGTPPPVFDPEDPDNPVEHYPVTDEDDEIVPAKQSAELELKKVADKDNVVKAGDEITYTLTVTNTGNVTLTDVTVNDEMLGGDLLVTPSTLAPGESGTASGTYTVTQEDVDNIDKIVNIATATGTPPGKDPEDPDNPKTPPVEEEVPVINNPKITLVKLADKETLVAGETITYTFTATNTGNQTLSNVNITDVLEGISEIEYLTINGDSITDVSNITLAPGDVLVASATYEVTQADVDSKVVYNHATVEGTPPPKENPEDPDNPIKQDPVTDDDDVKLPGTHEPAIELEKSTQTKEVAEAGEVITYKFVVTNTGNVTLDNVIVNDPMLEELGIVVDLEKTTLAPGESTTGYADYTVTQEDIDHADEIVNIATATGTPPGGDPEDPDNPKTPPVEEEVRVTKDPEITLVKHADKEELVLDETITYTFTATNTGNQTLSNVNITDALEGISNIEYVSVNGEAITDTTNIILVPGDVLVATATYVVTQADVDKNEVYNHATVEGTPPAKENPEDPDNPIEQDPVTDDDDAKVPSEHKPAIELEKTTQKEVITKAGETINYKFVVTNTGNVTLDNIEVNDPMLEELGIKVKLEKTSLLPGESTVGRAVYTVTQEDIENLDEIKNIATATGTPPGYDPEDPTTDPEDPGYPPVSPPSEENVPIEKEPSIKLVKQADKEQLVEGETITYTFTATNTGNLILTNVHITDDLDGISDIKYLTINGKTIENTANITLKPGDVLVATATYDVTQEDVDANEVHNHATVEGTPIPKENPEDPDNPIEQDPVTDDDDAKVPAEHKPEIALEKTTQKQLVTKADEIITYKFVVTNTGNVTLNEVQVDDPMLEELGIRVILEKTTLVPGEATVGYAHYKVTQEDIDNRDSIDNIATATGTPPGEDPDKPVSPPSEKEVPVEKNPAIDLEKVADKEVFTEVGEEITYTFTVTNTGNVTLTNVNVDDETFKVEILLDKTTLAPGESTTGTYTYTVTQADLDNGEIHNFASTEGTPPPVVDPEDPDNPVEQDPVTDEDDEKVRAVQRPDLALEKEADEQFVEKAGDTITYTLTVTNTGNVTLTDVTVNDEMLGGDLPVTPSTLAPGETGTVTGTYTVTQEDIDRHEEIINIATATGTPPGYDPENPPTDPEDPTNPPVTPPVEEEVPVVNDPEITLVKQADKERLVAGETITYTFTATNTGNTTLNKVSLVDELEGISEIKYLTVNDEPIADPDNITLKPGDVLVAKATYVVTQEDVNANEVYNHATVEGTPPAKDNPEDPENPIEQDPVTDDDEAKVPSEHKPGITIEKTANKDEVTEVGEIITYKFVVTNTGNVTLDNVTVNDPMLEAVGIQVELDKTLLAPGESTVGYAEYIVTQADLDNGVVYNVATTTGTPPGYDPEDPPTDPTDPGYPPVSPPSEVEVPTKQDPSIQLDKSSDVEKVTKKGQVVTYTFVITNTGNITLNNVALNDPMLGGNVTLNETTLAPGESTTVSVKYKTTKDDLNKDALINIATVTGETPEGQKVTDEDQDNIPVEVEDEKLVQTSNNLIGLTALGLLLLATGGTILTFNRRRKININE